MTVNQVHTAQTAPQNEGVRTEKDLVGDYEVPASAYYGVHTARSVDNFPITGIQIGSYPELVNALAAVKAAAARANLESDVLNKEQADAIVQACEDIRGGQLHDQFIADAIQGGAGTSTNMNTNEVVANRALEILGYPLGDYPHLHPLEQVNASQSTNDVYPSAARVALYVMVDELLAAFHRAAEAFEAKSEEFKDVPKLGRTQMQDAVPMTVGQEFGGYATWVREDAERIRNARKELLSVNLGGTAIGTGLNTPAGYGESVVKHLAEITGLPVVAADNRVAATPDLAAFVTLSAAIRTGAVRLSKIANDLRVLSSGPGGGFGEIALPAVQAGSSIMPGKVNPVIPEVVNQVAFEVIGHDVTVSMAAEGGQLQLNAFEPVVVKSNVEQITHLTNALNTFTDNCITGIEVNRDVMNGHLEKTVGIVTALNTVLGYDQSSQIAKDALAQGKPVAALVVERGLLTQEQLDDLLNPLRQAYPHDTK